jgi:hypothetical protein
LEVPGSNPGLKAGYPDWGFLCFYPFPQGNCRVSTLN